MKKSEAIARLTTLEQHLESCLGEVKDLKFQLIGSGNVYPIPEASEVPKVILLAEIMNKGGRVYKKTLHQIWKSLGKDTRGLGGFFKGKKALLAKDATGKILVTENSGRLLKKYRGYLKKKGYNFSTEEN